MTQIYIVEIYRDHETKHQYGAFKTKSEAQKLVDYIKEYETDNVYIVVMELYDTFDDILEDWEAD